MKITCIGHSGFAVECGEATLIFDYYTDERGVVEAILARAKRIHVFVSHSHRDHLNHDIFLWKDRYPIERYVIANECRRKLMRSMDLVAYPFTFIHHDEDFADGHIKVRAFNSTDAGVCFLVDIDGHSIFHAGDYNCWHFMPENTPADVKKAMGDYHVILHTIAAYSPAIDVAMFPVIPNIGGDFAYGARQFLATINVDLFLPMHTWNRYREAFDYDLYRNPVHGTCRGLRPGDTIEYGNE